MLACVFWTVPEPTERRYLVRLLTSLGRTAKRQVLKNPILRKMFGEQIRWSAGNKLVTCLRNNRIDLVVDIGANVGQTQELLRDYGYSGDILSIEPGDEAHAVLLEKSVADSRWAIAPRMAIGAEVGRSRINIARASDLSSLLTASPTLRATYPGSEAIRTEEVEIVPLDEILEPYWSRYESIFVKVDTQGFEEAVLDGARDSLRRIAGIQLELSLVELYEGEPNYLGVLRRLSELGFEPHLILETNFSFHLRRQVQFDLVAFRSGSQPK